MNEFVLFDPDGQECEWIDPVFEFAETNEAYIVHNGIFEYTVPKRPGFTGVVREMQVDDE